ncbi:hypothetical protein SU69_08865 [Thermosipho melanesiensis]|uniref:Uncharacterized protein n=2 Tax=Thermosipho melanesiensis TaxID=46541 RepID=A6LNU2_THEM4|nr:hypothetical protein [Thermosipho melanesiensis]ABR31593.1 hypothetical protein Tmel_1754 [Thermosipho melanesiensis BI429]APT74624.1 hypothetical protein BW47_09240 [Thermosipho melanesiensis]OOC35329.1 hypothetical protein SU69_08865 [Thermosipho melanesiensis]OOC35547.1 hypothetical protein SU70_08875 [Thermosipho melanesiensis]OOC36584.1 hypothetical protein SU68_08930 [Thermosipho melanesiensis]
MAFHYTIEMLLNDQKANVIMNNQEIIEIARTNQTEIKYDNGKLVLTCAPNHDIDEELVKKILSVVKSTVVANAYLIDGKSKVEIFNGKLDPKNPFGTSNEEFEERTIESLEEEDGITIDEDLEDFLRYTDEEE